MSPKKVRSLLPLRRLAEHSHIAVCSVADVENCHVSAVCDASFNGGESRISLGDQKHLGTQNTAGSEKLTTCRPPG